MTSVTIQSVWKYYGKVAAVRDLNLQAATGEFLCILGPSGCGKSSTMRMLAGLEHISAGDIHFGERRINDLPPKDRDIAMVFENYALYPHKTVFDNIANPLKLRRLDAGTIATRVARAATMLEIDHLLDRKPAQLSGGQKQRVAIGRAIVREPQLFLFDEPIAHLDAKLRAHMRGELKRLQRRLGTTTIYVTHDQLEALSMADRIAVMHDGVLQQVGTPAEIYNTPANEWVASFVGEPRMNFLDCVLQSISGEAVIRHDAFQHRLAEAQRAQANGCAGEVRLGVRPEDMQISMNDPRAAGWTQGSIFAVEPVGGDTLVEVSIGAARVLVKTRADFQGRMDEACWLSFNPAKIHLFDKAKQGLALF
jgi:multiple sugar transport system ATP-binding protein